MYKPKTKKKKKKRKKEKVNDRIRTKHHQPHATSPHHHTTQHDCVIFAKSPSNEVNPRTNLNHFLCVLNLVTPLIVLQEIKLGI